MTQKKINIFLALLGFLAIHAQAASRTWTPGLSGNWLDAGVWSGQTFANGDSVTASNGNIFLGSGNTISSSAQTFTFGGTAGSYTFINVLGANIIANTINLSPSGLLNMTSGNISTTNIVINGSGTPDGRFKFFGGNISVTNLTIGTSSNATFTQTSGQITADSVLVNNGGGSGNYIMTGGNLTASTFSCRPHWLGYGYSFLYGGNLTCTTLRNKVNGTIRIASANVVCTTLAVDASSAVKWEHLIGRTVGKYDQMGKIITANECEPFGVPKFGVYGGAALTSTNTFYLQVGASITPEGINNGYNVIPSCMYTTPQTVLNMDGTKDGVRTILASGNFMGSIDLATSSSNLWIGGKAAGWVTVNNCSSTLQRLGINVFFDLSSGTSADVVSKLVEAGYDAVAITDYPPYDLKFLIPASLVPSPKAYAVWDFRDVTTAVEYARVQEIMVAPAVSGSPFIIY